MPRQLTAHRAAYFLIDMSVLSDEARRVIIDDAALGGGATGVRVVEVAHNGPAQILAYGVYRNADHPSNPALHITDEDKWAAFKEDYDVPEGADSEDVADKVTDEAKAQADAAADAANAAEEAENRRIAGDSAADKAAGRTNGNKANR